MSLESRLTRMPRAFEHKLGADVAAAFAAGPIRDLVTGAAGTSRYLAGIIAREADWLMGAFDDPEAALTALSDSLTADTLRQAKARIAALIGLADLGGALTLEQVTGALSTFADRATEVALRHALDEAIRRKHLPEGATMSIFGMGKWGAHELNYSSDIDLICLFDHTIHPPEDVAEIRAGLVKVTRRLTALLSDVTDEGYVFRTDLRLRPDASVTPVCLPMTTAMSYYESVGRTWERAAWIKARPVAGDLKAAETFQAELAPFIWRRHLDFAAIADAQDIRLRIRDHKGLHSEALEGRNIKLGKGGIREIEFFAQTRQLIAGGRDPGLRQRDTVGALAALAAKGWVPPDVAQTLTDDYRAHREVEHRLQMLNDAQTHDLPTTDEGFERVAALMGTDVTTLRRDLTERLTRVARLTEPFFDPGAAPAPKADKSGRMDEIMSRWRTYPAFRTSRAVELFERIEPVLVAGLAKAADPDAALLSLDAFLVALPAGVQLFSLFSANPKLVELIVDICTASNALARHLGENPAVLDAVIAGDFFAPIPPTDRLAAEIARPLAALDYEDALLALRRLKNEWHFRIGVHHLRGLITAEEAGAAYARLAEAVLRALLPVVIADIARRHGTMPGQGVAVLGMGSLGAGWLTARSDLDLILIYDAAATDMSDGARPLAAQAYFARLTQAMITALKSPMAGGKLYDTDMRLRPSGRQGPVATSVTGFRDYQLGEAWTWEHLALVRARIVASDGAVAAPLQAVLDEVRGLRRDRAKVLGDVADMRRRLAEAKGDADLWQLKAGPGGLMDIELVAAAGELLAPTGSSGTVGQLQAGLVADPADLARAWELQQVLKTITALLSETPGAPEVIGGTAPALIARDTGIATDALEAALVAARDRAAAGIDRVLDARTA